MSMNDLPLISIIVPVYNVAPYLKRCLESIQGQTYRNIEIILVDDGSSDSSGRICEEYAAKDIRLKVMHKANGGLSAARNEGIIKASGEYISFVDSDDYVCETYIERLFRILYDHDADIAVCGYFRGREERLPKNKSIQGKQGKIRSYTAKEMLRQWHGKYKQIETVVWNKLYKKTLFTENNIFFPTGCVFEDVYISHLLIDKSQKIAITSEKLYYYYQRKDSTIHTVSEKRMWESILAQNKRLSFFEDNGYKAAYERLAVQRQKQYMLDYYTALTHGMWKLRREMLFLFKEQYGNLCHYKSVKIWERLIFFIFRYFYGVMNVLTHKRVRE